MDYEDDGIVDDWRSEDQADRAVARVEDRHRLLERPVEVDVDDDEDDEDEDAEEDYGDDPYGYDDDDRIDGVGFADPGGTSSLRAETEWNPRNLPCPTCGEPNRLTPLDVAARYQCNQCARAAEGWGP